MHLLRGQGGAALVTALMLTMLALVIAMALLYSVTMGTRVSASHKRYRSALAAAQGGVELFGEELLPLLFEPMMTRQKLKSAFPLIDLQLPQYECLQEKLTMPTASWNRCREAQLTADPGDSPDVTFRLGSDGPLEQGFLVKTKIVDTVPGNSDKNSAIDYLDNGASVAGKDEAIRPEHLAGIYNISMQGVREGGNSREKADLSVLYAY